jgi:hypothetical protein
MSRNDRSYRFACGKRLRRDNNGRTPVIHGGKLLVVLCRLTLLLDLRGQRRGTLLARRGDF